MRFLPPPPGTGYGPKALLAKVLASVAGLASLATLSHVRPTWDESWWRSPYRVVSEPQNVPDVLGQQEAREEDGEDVPEPPGEFHLGDHPAVPRDGHSARRKRKCLPDQVPAHAREQHHDPKCREQARNRRPEGSQAIASRRVLRGGGALRGGLRIAAEPG